MKLVLIIQGIAIIATGIQLGYWIFFFRRLACYSEDIKKEPLLQKKGQPPVSVVLCVRNEEKNIAEYLPHILNQRYRLFEVLVVNDNSTDETWFRLLDFQKKYSNLTVLNVPFATPPGKKTALTLGIKQAKYDLILLTDADCKPASPYWIQEMQRALRPGKKIVLGFSPYMHAQGFLNTFIRFEAIQTAVQYFSFALAGMPYMGVGRNLMYNRQLFLQVDGFTTHREIASGDDDLFINAVANKQNTAVVLTPDSFVYTRPKHTWAGYYYQKSRHFSTGKHYQRHHQVLLGGLALSHFFHLVGILVLMAFPEERSLAISLFMVRYAVVAGFYYPILKRFQEVTLWYPVLIIDALFPAYYALFAPKIFFGNRATWRQS